MIELREVETEFFLGVECRDCPWLNPCGGLRSENALLTCTSLCCQDREHCTLPCPENPPMFKKQFFEVGGFSLNNIPSLPSLKFALPPQYVPFVKSGKILTSQALISDWVAIPMHELLTKVKLLHKYRNRADFLAKFDLRPSTKIIICGDGLDHKIEPLWKLWGDENFVSYLKGLKPAIVTPPDFSMYKDVPRTSNLHNMKRIALYWHFLAKASLPTALHVNSRTSGDWQRWATFLREHEEINLVSYEFGSGSGDPSRWAIHLRHLCALQENVGRSLTAIVKGGKRMKTELIKGFSSVCVLDTDPYMKSIYYQRATLKDDGSLGWETLEEDSPIRQEELLSRNLELCMGLE